MAVRQVRVKIGERWFTVEVEQPLGSPARVTVEGETYLVEVGGPTPGGPSPGSTVQSFSAPPPTPAPSSPAPPAPSAVGLITSPMAGKVLAIRVRPGDEVAAGDEVCVVEAMKMEQSIQAPRSGTVKQVHVTPMQQVNMNAPLVELE